MTYELKPLGCNPAKLKGLLEKLIVSHYENNYGGAVKRSMQSLLSWSLWISPLRPCSSLMG